MSAGTTRRRRFSSGVALKATKVSSDAVVVVVAAAGARGASSLPPITPWPAAQPALATRSASTRSAARPAANAVQPDQNPADRLPPPRD